DVMASPEPGLSVVRIVRSKKWEISRVSISCFHEDQCKRLPPEWKVTSFCFTTGPSHLSLTNPPHSISTHFQPLQQAALSLGARHCVQTISSPSTDIPAPRPE